MKGRKRQLQSGDSVCFFDGRGKYVLGTVEDAGTLRVQASNVSGVGTILYKQSYWSWEKCTTRRNGSTAFKPRHLIALTRLFEFGWGNEYPPGEDHPPWEEVREPRFPPRPRRAA